MASLKLLASAILVCLATAASTSRPIDRRDGPLDFYSEVLANEDLRETLQSQSQNVRVEHDVDDKNFQGMVDNVEHFHSITVVGDSYSSGDGAFRDAGLGLCRKNEGSFGWRLNKLLEPDEFSFLPCSGAPVRDVLNKQVNNKDYAKPDLVLMTAGADNGGVFIRVLMGCVLKPTKEKCDNALQSASRIADDMPKSLEPLYKAIKAKEHSSRKREIVHLGYVQMYNRDNPKDRCPAFTQARGVDVTWPSSGKGGYRDKINKAIVKINSQIQKTAKKHGITYIDVDALFDGHRFCDGPDVSWVQHRLTIRQEGGIVCHPTFDGHGAYINATLQYLSKQ